MLRAHDICIEMKKKHPEIYDNSYLFKFFYLMKLLNFENEQAFANAEPIFKMLMDQDKKYGMEFLKNQKMSLNTILFQFVFETS